MMNPTLQILLLSASLILFAEPSKALRCGTKIISIGDGKHKILARCGEPDFVETREQHSPPGCSSPEYSDNYEPRYYSEHYGRPRNYPICLVKILEVWTYNFGPHKFIKELVFEDGLLKEINNLEYGY